MSAQLDIYGVAWIGAAHTKTPAPVGEYKSVPTDAPTSTGTWTPNSTQLRGGRTS